MNKVEAGFRVEDIHFQPALVGPPIMAALIAFAAAFAAELIRNYEARAVIVFPPNEVGIGDAAVVLACVWAMGWSLSRIALVVVQFPDRPADIGVFWPSTTEMLWCPSFGMFGMFVWGAAAGISTTKSKGELTPSTSWWPALAGALVSAIYHLCVWAFAAGYLFIFAGPILALLSLLGVTDFGPPKCIFRHTDCTISYETALGFLRSCVISTGATVACFYFWDFTFGVKRILAVRRTVKRIDFGEIHGSPTVTKQSATVSILHLTDLHFVSDDAASRVETHPGPPFGNSLLRIRLESLAETMERSDVVVFSGDITDSGSAAEWRELQRLVRAWPDRIRRKTIWIPGNHDLNFVVPASRAMRKRDTMLLHGRLQRQALYARFCRQFLQAGDEFLSLRDGVIVRSTPNDWFDNRHDEMRSLMNALDRGVLPDDVPASTLAWQVPAWVRKVQQGELKCAFLAVDTSQWGWTAGTNALGAYSGELQELVVRWTAEISSEGYVPIVIGHHAMIPIFEKSRKETLKEQLFVAGAAQLYGDVWFEGLVRAAPKIGFVYLHGHRHVTRGIGTEIAKGSRAYLLGAPSLLFGDEFDHETEKIGCRHRISLDLNEPSAPLLSVQTEILWD